MAGPNLELFKFGMYLFFPLAVMVHYGDPSFYSRHVLPIRDQFWPKEESLYRPPRNSEDLKTALDEMKAKRLAKREARLREQGEEVNDTSASSTSTRVATSPMTQKMQDSKISQLVEDQRSQRLV
ncbi:related to PET100 |uniref:Related to PET100 \|nr:related to PET100 \